MKLTATIATAVLLAFPAMADQPPAAAATSPAPAEQVLHVLLDRERQAHEQDAMTLSAQITTLNAQIATLTKALADLKAKGGAAVVSPADEH